MFKTIRKLLGCKEDYWQEQTIQSNIKLREMEKELDSLKSKLPTTPYELIKYILKYKSGTIVYKCRYVNDKAIPVDVRNFLTPHDGMLKNLTATIINRDNSDDEKAVKILEWVVKNIKYTSDKKEHWQFPFETIKLKTGDCDDMSILLSSLLVASGIHPLKVRLTCGYVNNLKKEFGHCYPTYYDETKDRWVLLDATFYPNYLTIQDRKDYKLENKYKKVWFSWDVYNCYYKDLRDIEKLKDMEVI